METTLSAEISKVDDDKRLVFGWAYVSHDPAGMLQIDKSGDVVSNPEELEKSAYDFVLTSRDGGDFHQRTGVATLVESVMFTPEKIEKMGIPPGTVPTGWWVGFKVHDDEVWKAVKTGRYKSFSVHGSGIRKERVVKHGDKDDADYRLLHPNPRKYAESRRKKRRLKRMRPVPRMRADEYPVSYTYWKSLGDSFKFVELQKDKVSSLAGVRRYHAPIGTPIVAGRAVRSLRRPGKEVVDDKHAATRNTKHKDDKPLKRKRRKPKNPARVTRTGHLNVRGTTGRQPQHSIKGLGGLGENADAFYVSTQQHPIAVKTVDEAIRLIHQGHYVELPHARQVSTLTRKLGKYVQEAVAKDGKVPKLNLCLVSVRGSNLFCAENKGIPRLKMPQLQGHPQPGSRADKLPEDRKHDGDGTEVNLYPEFRAMLEAMGAEMEDTTERVDYLKATQDELKGPQVAGIANFLRRGYKNAARRAAGKKPILGGGEGGRPKDYGGNFDAMDPLFVSEDDYIVDGHHRWAAQIAVDLDDGKPGSERIRIVRVNMDIQQLLALSLAFAIDWGIPPVGITDDDVKKSGPPCIGCEPVSKFRIFRRRRKNNKYADVYEMLERQRKARRVLTPPKKRKRKYA